jgi:protein pelota
MNIKKRGYKEGFAVVIPETIDDLYTLYNIILPSDRVKARTSRRIRFGDEEGRADKGERRSMILTIEVEEVNFHQFANRLRIKGTIIEGPEDLVSFGSYHTINVEKGTLLTIQKDFWEKVAINRLEEAVKRSQSAQVIIVAIDDEEATVAAVGAFSSKTIGHFKERLPHKGGSQKKRRNQLIIRFFDKVILAIEEAFKSTFQDAVALIIGGPGFTKDQFVKHLKQTKTKDTAIPLNKIFTETASCGGPSAIGEIISKGILTKII